MQVARADYLTGFFEYLTTSGCCSPYKYETPLADSF